MNQPHPISHHYDQLASKREYYRSSHAYYYSLLHREYQYFIPKNKKILEVGCGTGELLHALKPSLGIGVDLSPEMIKIARQKFLQFKFYAGDIKNLKFSDTFDTIILSGTLGEADDIQELLSSLKPLCHSGTRIVIEYYSYFWQYFLKLAEHLNWKMPQRIQNWITAQDITNFLSLSGFEPVKQEKSILFPFEIPVVSYVVNRYIAKLPLINALTLNHFIMARPVFESKEETSVSVIIPCRNERGNVEQAIVRTPVFGTKQEFIFVEGKSSDGTYEEIERIIQKYPEKNIRLLKQKLDGKGDAVRLGFAEAQHDMLMILDCDLTVAPEDLPKFYQALIEGRGEFINGSRLVYQMEKDAMRFLNLLGNKFFSVFFTWLLGQHLKDTLCGTKVLYRRDYEEIARNRHYFGDFDPFGDFDLIFGAVKLNLKVIELPIHYRSRQYGETQIKRFQHGWLLLRMCFFAMKKIKFR